ncbi:MAG: hypothetical protein HY784_09170 [Chloroflexi bacterium]|nr:hypothetical protein [Chloroflexota bacterium]
MGQLLSNRLAGLPPGGIFRPLLFKPGLPFGFDGLPTGLLGLPFRAPFRFGQAAVSPVRFAVMLGGVPARSRLPAVGWLVAAAAPGAVRRCGRSLRPARLV